MPTIEERLIKTGRLRWRYRDFPLQQHPFSRLAAHSAACADEQGKFWDQHQRIYDGQADWSAARDAAGIFRDYAKAIGLDLASYDACMSSGKYAGRIQASQEEGTRLGVSLYAHADGRREALPGQVRFRRHHPPRRFARAARHEMKLPHGRGAPQSPGALRLRLSLPL